MIGIRPPFRNCAVKAQDFAANGIGSIKGRGTDVVRKIQYRKIVGVAENKLQRLQFLPTVRLYRGRNQFNPDWFQALKNEAEKSSRSKNIYLITLSARYSMDCGIVRPICFAVLRLITSSNFVGCSTGRSAGLAPFRILVSCSARPFSNRFLSIGSLQMVVAQDVR